MEEPRTLQVGDAPELNALIAQVTNDATPAILVAQDGTRAVLMSAIMHEALIARLQNVEAALQAAQAGKSDDPSP